MPLVFQRHFMLKKGQGLKTAASVFIQFVTFIL